MLLLFIHDVVVIYVLSQCCCYLCILHLHNETVKMEDTKVPRVKEFKYLESTLQESGSCEREVKKRVQAG